MPVGAGDSRACPLPIDERGRVVKPGKGIENPLELDAEGNLVPPAMIVRRAARCQQPAAPIYMARRSTGGKRQRLEAEAAPSGVTSRESPGAARERVAPRALTPVPDVAAEPEAPRVQQSLVRVAARYRIHPAFTEEGLWLTAARPRDVKTVKLHHVCSICWNVKCHPVTSNCGHSHYFVCIRLWLQQAWSCPDCKQKMYYRPMRQWAEEQEIDASYPGWSAETAVSYSWAGLKFAKDPLYPYYG